MSFSLARCARFALSLSVSRISVLRSARLLFASRSRIEEKQMKIGAKNIKLTILESREKLLKEWINFIYLIKIVINYSKFISDAMHQQNEQPHSSPFSPKSPQPEMSIRFAIFKLPN
jgi:hypothetical protein